MPGVLEAASRLFRNHPVVLIAGMFISSWIAVATLTWAVSEHVRVAPMKAELEAQIRAMKAELEAQITAKRSSPVIRSILVTPTLTDSGLRMQQRIHFTDPEGDAVFVNYVMLRTNATSLSLTTGTINISREDQIKGADATSEWTCDGTTYFLELRAIITDAAGNASLPKDYRIECYDWRRTGTPKS